MRTASSTERLEEIILKNTSPNCRSAVRLEIDEEKNGNYNVINDLDVDTGITWTDSGKKEQYGNFSLTPLPGTVAFNLVNKEGKYSDGSGTAFEGVIDKETKVRLKAGPILSTLGAEVTESFNLNNTSGIFIGSYNYHSTYSGSYLVIDSAGLGETPPHFSDVFVLYDSTTYDTYTYDLDSYTIHTYDNGSEGWNQMQSFSVTANNTNGKIYYRFFDDPQLADTSKEADWTYAADTINGTVSTVISNESRFIQVAVTYDGISWSDDYRVTDISITYKSYVEFLYKSVYYLDRPSYSDPPAPEMPMISCKGRDAYKKAVTTDINIADLTGGVSIENLIKDVCDQIGIKYSATSIDIDASFSDRTSANGVDIIKADVFFNYMMQILNTEGYQMYLIYDDTLDDNIMYVQPRPDTSDASGAFNYQNYISIGDVSRNADRILKRMTVYTDDNSTLDEGLLNNTNYTTTGSKTASWATGNREFKRIVIDKPDDITISNLECNPNSITFDIDSITGTVNIKVYGSACSSTPTAEGEAISIDNEIAAEGLTSKIVNPLILSNAECKSIAESYIQDYENPPYEARSLTWPYLYLIPELNDLYMLWRRFIFTTDVFYITKVTHRWSSGRNPNESTVFNLDDTGTDRGAPKWDDGISDWDRGWVWDMGISSPLDSQEEVDAASDALTVYNVDFA